MVPGSAAGGRGRPPGRAVACRLRATLTEQFMVRDRELLHGPGANHLPRSRRCRLSMTRMLLGPQAQRLGLGGPGGDPAIRTSSYVTCAPQASSIP